MATISPAFCMLFLRLHALLAASLDGSRANRRRPSLDPSLALIPSQRRANRGADEASPLRRAIDDSPVPALSALSAPTVEQKPGRGVLLPAMYSGLGTLQAWIRIRRFARSMPDWWKRTR